MKSNLSSRRYISIDDVNSENDSEGDQSNDESQCYSFKNYKSMFSNLLKS